MSVSAARVFAACAYAPRKWVIACLLLLCAGVFTVAVLSTASSRLVREDQMEQRLAAMQAHINFLESLYRARQEELMSLQAKLGGVGNDTPHMALLNRAPSTTMSSELTAMLKNITGSKAAKGINPNSLQVIRTPFVYQLLPHLMNDPFSLRPAYHMKGDRSFVDLVLGIPTIKRDKESYLMLTLKHLIDGMPDADTNSTLIVVLVGETDLEYVVTIARQIEKTLTESLRRTTTLRMALRQTDQKAKDVALSTTKSSKGDGMLARTARFPKYVESGLIEVMSPSPSYYPDFEALTPTLGDSAKRFKWRTKQNLDTMYLMAYGQTRGTYYLMLEDDVIAKKDYVRDIKLFTSKTSIVNPRWFFIEYCPVGGIGKLFRSADLLHFITYVQLFYNNLPIDWLLESYLADRVCTIEKTSKQCGRSKSQIRPKYKTSLFLHIGLYSSLKGKIHKVKNTQFGSLPTFYAHVNPPLESMRCDIAEHTDHSLRAAYEGTTYFWGVKPKKGDVVEFWFAKPTAIDRYTFRSGNIEHVSDKFYDTVVETLPANGSVNFSQVGAFDEFGLADGWLKNELGPLSAIRLRVTKDSAYWVLLSEIELRPYTKEDSR